MPGFVDVSDMTSEEVRRLGHADDYDEPTYKQSTSQKYTGRSWSPMQSNKTVKPIFNFLAEDVWTASAYAYRTNGNEYIKAVMPGVPNRTNREKMMTALLDNILFEEQDIEFGKKMRQHFQTLTFKVLKGAKLSDFQQNAMAIAEKKTIISNFDFSVIASLPATYTRATKRNEVDSRIRWAQGGFIGQEGDKVTQKIEVIKILWSNNYNTWYYTGINDKDQVLFFNHKGTFKIGDCVTIEGKVKSHRDNSTQLSHVKVIENV